MAPDRKRLLLALATVVGLATLVYLNSLQNGFALDDESIIENNEQVHGIDRIPEAVTGPYWPTETAERGLYRPLTLTTYALNWELTGDDPSSFHLVNVLLHALVSALVLLLLLHLGAGLTGAWAGALVFAVHPVHVEAVANIVGRAELLAAAFFLAATLLYVRADHGADGGGRKWGRGGGGGRGWGTALVVAACYFLALISKEHVIVLPGILALYHLYRERAIRPAVDRALASWRVYAAMGVAVVAYFLARKANIGVFLGTETPAWYYGMAEYVRILTAIRVWPEYLRLMLVPFDLVPDYGPGVIVPETSPFSPLVLLGLLTGIAVALVAWRARRALPLLSAGVAFFVVTALPVTGILFPVGVILAERTLYLPSVGVAMGVAAIAAWVRHGLRQRAVRPWPALALFALVLAAASARTWTANPVWRDSLTVLNHLMDHHPANFRVQWGLANHFTERGDTTAALAQLELASRMVPGHVGLRVQYAQMLLDRGRYAAAAAQADTALAIIPGMEVAHWFRVTALLGAGEAEGAAAAAGRALERWPDSAPLHDAHARALARTGSYHTAARARRAALGLGPSEHAPALWTQWAHLAGIEMLRGDHEAAAHALQQARAAAPPERSVPDTATLARLLEERGTQVIPLW